MHRSSLARESFDDSQAILPRQTNDPVVQMQGLVLYRSWIRCFLACGGFCSCPAVYITATIFEILGLRRGASISWLESRVSRGGAADFCIGHITQMRVG